MSKEKYQSDVWFISDLHIDHRGISKKFRTEFKDDEDHANTIIENYKKVITKRSLVYFLGDVAFSSEGWDIIAKLPGRKRIVLGNHDRVEDMDKITQIFEKVEGLGRYKGFWISHAPIHPEELRGKRNLHGHVHNQSLDDNRYFNCSMENIGYAPINFCEILERMGVDKYGMEIEEVAKTYFRENNYDKRGEVE